MESFALKTLRQVIERNCRNTHSKKKETKKTKDKITGYSKRKETVCHCVIVLQR